MATGNGSGAGAGAGFGEVEQLAARMEASRRMIGQRAARVVRRSAAQVEALSKQNAPVDTGNLRNSITTIMQGDGRFATMQASIGPTAHYGGYVEYGTSRMAPQPYLGPALDAVKPEFEAAMRELGATLGNGAGGANGGSTGGAGE